MHKYEEAAAAFSNYVNLLPNKDRSEKAAWSRPKSGSCGRSATAPASSPAERHRGTVHTHALPAVEREGRRARQGQRQRAQDFVVDTGAEKTVISRQTAQRLGIAPITYTLSAGVGDVGLRGLQLGAHRLARARHARSCATCPCLIKNPPLRTCRRTKPRACRRWRSATR